MSRAFPLMGIFVHQHFDFPFSNSLFKLLEKNFMGSGNAYFL
jgi:hypothetical protein